MNSLLSLLMMGSNGGGEIKRRHNQEVIQHSFFLIYYLNFKVILPSKLRTIQVHTQMPSLLWQTLDESLFNITEFFLGVERKWYRICRASQKICCIASADRVERGFRRLPSPNASFNRWENWDPKGSSGFSQSPRASWCHPKLTASAPHQVRTILPPSTDPESFKKF